MKKLLSLFKPKPAILRECTSHDSIKFPNIQASELCINCDKQFCYICSSKHIDAGHKVIVSKSCFHDQSEFKMQTINFPLKDTHHVLEQFNIGNLVRLNWNEVDCLCGSKVSNQENSALCIACGTVTCSNQCHTHYMTDKSLCRINEEFKPSDPSLNLRAIQLKNIKHLLKKGATPGMPVNNTSQHFIIGFMTSTDYQIYLQRGYRQYGNPQLGTLNGMEVVQGTKLDNEVNLYKICECQCMDCQERGYHPVLNCQHVCKSEFMMVNIEDLFFLQKRARDLSQEPSLQETCSCECSVCTSGLTIFQHTKIDCLRVCEKSILFQVK